MEITPSFDQKRSIGSIIAVGKKNTLLLIVSEVKTNKFSLKYYDVLPVVHESKRKENQRFVNKLFEEYIAVLNHGIEGILDDKINFVFRHMSPNFALQLKDKALDYQEKQSIRQKEREKSKAIRKTRYSNAQYFGYSDGESVWGRMQNAKGKHSWISVYRG